MNSSELRAWYICKARYMEEDDKGFSKVVVREYLLDAVNYCDAEQRIHEELEAFINGGFQIMTIVKTKINEVYTYDDGVHFYKIKIIYNVMDGDSGKEKKITNYAVLPADDVEEARSRIKEELSKLMADNVIESIIQTKIIEVFPHVEKQES